MSSSEEHGEGAAGRAPWLSARVGVGRSSGDDVGDGGGVSVWVYQLRSRQWLLKRVTDPGAALNVCCR